MSLITIDTDDPEVRFILGRPNFWCGPYAHLMRDAGQDIPEKSEVEQGIVIAWMLRLYAEHGMDWRCAARAEITALQAKLPTGTKTTSL